MQWAPALWGASALSLAVLASVGCGGNVRTSAAHRDNGTRAGQSAAGGDSGSSHDSGAGGNSTGGAPAGASGSPGGDTSQHASNYDRLCLVDGQCWLVNDTSDACGCNTCLNDAIVNTDVGRWTRDRDSFNCPPISCPALSCPEMLRVCANHQCGARAPFIVDASNYDTTCSHDSDCTTIPVGEMCAFCQCDLGAVSLRGLRQYNGDRATVACNPFPPTGPIGSVTPDPCHCPLMGSARCSLSMDAAPARASWTCRP